MISLKLVRPEDAPDLLAFELRNRAFFRTWVPDRGDSYYTLENVAATIATAMAEAAAGTWWAYLVRDAAGALVGRVNLTRGDQGQAELGYRVGEAHGGRGFATRAVGLAVEQALGPLGFTRVDATTTVSNVGSQQVLLRNGFVLVGRTPRAVALNGEWQEFVHFRRSRSSEHKTAEM